jgi:hypothetical protein
MEIEKLLCYGAMIVAGAVCLFFLLDLTVGLLGRNMVVDILFVIGAVFVLWQGIETSREFR